MIDFHEQWKILISKSSMEENLIKNCIDVIIILVIIYYS